jgi:uncharacterized integral membrane protein
MQLGIILGLIFGLIITIFAVLNTGTVIFRYYFGTVETSVAVLVLAAAALGAISVGLFSFLKTVRTGFTLWDYQNKLQRLTKEVGRLKAQKEELTADLSFLEAECEQKVREKDSRLDECQESNDVPQESETVVEQNIHE